MNMTSNKPYMIRAIYDWILDNHCTPYMLVYADYIGNQLPQHFVQDGKILLNVSPNACRGIVMDNEKIIFTARFSGKVEQIVFAPGSVLAVYAKENGRGMEFELEVPLEVPPSTRKGPQLTLVKDAPSDDSSQNRD